MGGGPLGWRGESFGWEGGGGRGGGSRDVGRRFWGGGFGGVEASDGPGWRVGLKGVGGRSCGSCGGLGEGSLRRGGWGYFGF